MRRSSRLRLRRLPDLLLPALAVLVVADLSVATVRAGTVDPPEQVLSCSAPADLPLASSPVLSSVSAAAAVRSSVVSVTATTNTGVTEGSGIVLRSDGLVVTNNHVVAGVAVNGGQIELRAHNGKSSVASIVGRVPGHDVALVRAEDLTGLRPAVLRSAAGLRVGDDVISVGNALGEEGSVSAGIVSALHRTACVETPDTRLPEDEIFGNRPALPTEVTLRDLIQTDAHINPGSSGGALADLSGRVVGLTTMSKSADGSAGSVGVGFAIPIETVFADVDRLLGRPSG